MKNAGDTGTGGHGACLPGGGGGGLTGLCVQRPAPRLFSAPLRPWLTGSKSFRVMPGDFYAQSHLAKNGSQARRKERARRQAYGQQGWAGVVSSSMGSEAGNSAQLRRPMPSSAFRVSAGGWVSSEQAGAGGGRAVDPALRG